MDSKLGTVCVEKLNRQMNMKLEFKLANSMSSIASCLEPTLKHGEHFVANVTMATTPTMRLKMG